MRHLNFEFLTEEEDELLEEDDIWVVKRPDVFDEWAHKLWF